MHDWQSLTHVRWYQPSFLEPESPTPRDVADCFLRVLRIGIEDPEEGLAEGVRLFFVEHFAPCSWAFSLAGTPSWVRRTGGQLSPPPVLRAARAASPA